MKLRGSSYPSGLGTKEGGDNERHRGRPQRAHRPGIPNTARGQRCPHGPRRAGGAVEGWSWDTENTLNIGLGDFSGGPVIKSPCFHCRGVWVQSLVRERRSCMPCSMDGQKKKKKIVLRCFSIECRLSFSLRPRDQANLLESDTSFDKRIRPCGGLAHGELLKVSRIGGE